MTTEAHRPGAVRPGRLSIFFGAAPRIGKTAAMLQAAQRRQQEGARVAIGLIERLDEAAGPIAAALPAIPARRQVRGEALFQELDVAAILAERPDLVVVDEAQRRNVPDSPHRLRCEDIRALLAAGIDVCTTLSLAHLDSQHDRVAELIGPYEAETVPDDLLDRADAVALIDLGPAALAERFAAGDLPLDGIPREIAPRLFSLRSLTILRELAHRQVAWRFEEDLAHGAARGNGPILVAIGRDFDARRLVQMGHRLAERRHQIWYVLHVEEGQDDARAESINSEALLKALTLADRLGARTAIVPGRDVAQTVLDFAASHQVRDILVGRSRRPGLPFLRRSIAGRLLDRAGAIRVHMVATEQLPSRRPSLFGAGPWPGYQGYAIGALAAFAAAAAAELSAALVGGTLPALFLPLGILISGMLHGHGPARLTAVLGTALYALFSLPPLAALAFSPPGLLRAPLFLLLGLATGQLAGRMHEETRAARQREERLWALFRLSRALAAAPTAEEVLRAITHRIDDVVGGQTVILLPQGEKQHLAVAHPPDVVLPPGDLEAAEWAFHFDDLAGRGTDTLPEATRLYRPLRTANASIGVLGVANVDRAMIRRAEDRWVLDALAALSALAIERMTLAGHIVEARLSSEADTLRAALLSSISHDLRTPLASIIGSASTLQHYGDRLDATIRAELLTAIQDEAERLNGFISNLLQMTKLEAGAITLRAQPTAIEDVIGAVLESLGPRLHHHDVRLDIAPDLPMIRVDFVLIKQALGNLLDNAMKFSPAGAPIELRACRAGGELLVEVIDAGVGIPVTNLERIFDKFYRIRQRDRQAAGTGLGLSIAKALIERHGGRIEAESAGEGQGSCFRVRLPIMAQEDHAATRHNEALHAHE
jgi:two-component system sensor histidine kinase KdpD